MPRYFFDVQDGYATKDDEGFVLDSADAVAETAMKLLFEVGQLEVMRNNKRDLMVIVRDDKGKFVYRTELKILAEWLDPE